MAKLGDVIKISDADYTALKNAGSAGYVINGVRYYYSENNIYLTSSNGGGGGGTATDVQINGTSITSSNIANILTQGTYDSSTNKIATMSDVPSVSLTTTTGSEKITVGSSSLNVATRDTAETFSAIKTFSSGPLLNNGIYLSGKNASGTSRQLIGVNSSNQTVVGNTSQDILLSTSNAVIPNTTSNKDLGSSSYKWQDIWLSGGLRSDSTSHKLQLPSMSSWTADKTIATTDYVVASPSSAYYRILQTIGINGTNYIIEPTLYHNNVQIQFNTDSDRGIITVCFDNYVNYQNMFVHYISEEGYTPIESLWLTLQTYSNVASSTNNFGGATSGGAFYSNYHDKLCVIVKMYMTSTQMVIEYVNCSDGSYGSIAINKSSTSYFTDITVKSDELNFSEE